MASGLTTRGAKRHSGVSQVETFAFRRRKQIRKDVATVPGVPDAAGIQAGEGRLVAESPSQEKGTQLRYRHQVVPAQVGFLVRDLPCFAQQGRDLVVAVPAGFPAVLVVQHQEGIDQLVVPEHRDGNDRGFRFEQLIPVLGTDDLETRRATMGIGMPASYGPWITAPPESRTTWRRMT